MTTIHTYPDPDVIEHVTDGGDCSCLPTTVPVMHEDGSNDWQVIHNQLGED